MGIIYSYLMGNGRTDDPDKTTGLTSRDRYLVRITWKEARSNPVQLGVDLLVELVYSYLIYFFCEILYPFRFLDKYPEYIKMFPFRNLPPEKFPEDKKFQAHCANIIFTLGALIESLDNPDVLVEMLKKSGESHGKRKVPAKAYSVSFYLINATSNISNYISTISI